MVIAGDATGHSRPGDHHHPTRHAAGVLELPPAHPTVLCGAFPKPAAAPDLAGGLTPAGLTLFDQAFDLPWVADKWALAQLILDYSF